MFQTVAAPIKKVISLIAESEQTHRRQAAILYMTLSSFLFVASSFFIKNVVGMPAQTLLSMRCVISMLINSTIIMNKPEKEDMFPEKDTFRMICYRISFGVIADFCYISMFKYLNVSDGIALALTFPIISAVMAGILLHEKVSRIIYLSLLMCLIGILFICKPPFIMNLLSLNQASNNGNSEEQLASEEGYKAFFGIAMGLGFAFFLSLSICLTRRLSGRTSNYVIMQHLYFQTIVLVSIYNITTESDLSTIFTLNNAGMLFGTGLMHYFAQIVFGKSFFLEEANRILPFSYTQIFFSFIADIFVFHTQIDASNLFGSCLIVGGSYITTVYG